MFYFTKSSTNDRLIFLWDVYTQLLSHVQFFVTPWTVAYQAPLSMEFFRQKCWSELSFLSPGNRSNPRIDLSSLVSSGLAGRFFTTVSRIDGYKLGRNRALLKEASSACNPQSWDLNICKVKISNLIFLWFTNVPL